MKRMTEEADEYMEKPRIEEHRKINIFFSIQFYSCAISFTNSIGGQNGGSF